MLVHVQKHSKVISSIDVVVDKCVIPFLNNEEIEYEGSDSKEHSDTLSLQPDTSHNELQQQKKSCC